MAKIKSVTVRAGQTIWDIAVQEYNTPEGSILLLQANPDISLATVLVPGTELVIWAPEAVKALTEILKVDPYASSIQSMLMEWATLVMRPAAEGGTTTELNPGFGIRINDFIASINLDDLNLSSNITRDDIVMFIRPSATGTNRYMKIPLSEALKLSTWDNYLRTLRDVSLTELADNQFIKFDFEAGLWKNDPVLGIGELAYPDTSPILWYNAVTGKLAWLDIGTGLQITDTTLHINADLIPEELWKRDVTTLSPVNAGDDLDLGTGGMLAADIRAKAFNADGDPGITGNVTLMSGVSFDGTDKFVFNTKTISYKAGLVIGIIAGADINITIPRTP